MLRNCSKHLQWKEVCAHVENYCARMQYSDYNKKFRTEDVRSARCAYDKMRGKDENGEEPVQTQIVESCRKSDVQAC